MGIFSRTSKTAAPAAEEELVLVAENANPAVVGKELAEYEKVAGKIGFENPAFLELRLRNFFAASGICVFPYENVFAYLEKKFGKANGWNRTWGWRPLREKDVNTVSYGDRQTGGFYDQNGFILNNNGNYVAKVPLPVLMTVEKIAEAFPHVHLFVSDQVRAGDRTGDPFLAVIVQNMQPLVIERWDEPSFRM